MLRHAARAISWTGGSTSASGEVLRPVEVAVRDDRQPRASDPGEEVVAVAELEAVARLGRPLRFLRPTRGRPRAEVGERVRVRRDQRCSLVPRSGQRRVESGMTSSP